MQIIQSVASFVMTQKYANLESIPVETTFYFPRDIESVITNLSCEFSLRDGTNKLLETKVEERQKAQVKYEDAVASGKTAVIGSLGKAARDMISISIGQFPPMSKAVLKFSYFQKLDYDDMSYCLRVPEVYVPRYIGDI